MNRPQASRGSHRWHFVRHGGFDQVSLETADDLRHLAELDPKLWTALVCPTQGLEFDAQTMALIDHNSDGNIGVQEVLSAVDWACRRLVDPQVLFGGGDLALADIANGDEEGSTLRAGAARVLAVLGRPEATQLAVADFADMTLLFKPDNFNGDGVVPVALAAREGLDALVDAIVKTQGGVNDRSGEPGATLDTATAFFEQAAAVAAWREEAQAEAERILPLGPATADAALAFAAVQAKVEDFFTRCRLAAFDARSADALNPAPESYGGFAETTLAPDNSLLAGLPLATVAAAAPLPLRDGLNPAWADRLDALRRLAVEPLLGPRDALTPQDWAALRDRLAEHLAWRGRQPVSALVDLDAEALALLVADDAQQRLAALVERDSAADASAATIDALKRLVHYHRDLVTLLRNFVALTDFYDPTLWAIFQAGTLYIDQRSCELVLRVNDMAAHAKMAPFSNCYLLYCLCERAGHDAQTVVAALTSGAVDDLMVPGRHGILVDRAGRDWKATVLKVVEQPVSIRQAFFAPYRRVAGFIETQVRNFAAAKDKEVETRSQTVAQATTAAAPAAAKAPPPAFDVARFAGIFAAIGLAVGALGTALTAALAGLFQLAWWQWPLALTGILLAISGPSMLLAWLKLRRRSLGPLLDANGWAVNARARINLPFGRSLTGLATLPSNARRTRVDPFADRRGGSVLWLVLAALGAGAAWSWQQGWLARLAGLAGL